MGMSNSTVSLIAAADVRAGMHAVAKGHFVTSVEATNDGRIRITIGRQVFTEKPDTLIRIY